MFLPCSLLPTTHFTSEQSNSLQEIPTPSLWVSMLPKPLGVLADLICSGFSRFKRCWDWETGLFICIYDSDITWWERTSILHTWISLTLVENCSMWWCVFLKVFRSSLVSAIESAVRCKRYRTTGENADLNSLAGLTDHIWTVPSSLSLRLRDM